RKALPDFLNPFSFCFLFCPHGGRLPFQMKNDACLFFCLLFQLFFPLLRILLLLLLFVQTFFFLLQFPSPVFQSAADRKSTRLNSSHVSISYAVFCLKKKKINEE